MEDASDAHLVCPYLPPKVKEVLQQQIQSLDFAFVISDCSKDDMPITFASTKFYELTGYGPQEVIGKNCRFLQGKGTERRKVMEIRDAIREDRSCQVCLLNYKKDGTPFWNQFYMSPIHDDQGLVTHYVGIQCDVTSSMGTPRISAMCSFDSVAEDAAAEAAEEQVNAAAAAAGHLSSLAAAITSSQQQLGHSGEAPASSQSAAAGGAGGGNGASSSRGGGGSEDSEVSEDEEVPGVLMREQQDAAQLCGFVQAAHPVSSSPLPSSLSLALLRVQQSFVLSDPRLPDCPIVHASQRFLDMTGYSREEVVGRNCRFLQGPGTDPAEVAKLSAAIHATPPQPVTVTLLNYTKSGRPFWNCLHVAAVRDADGAVEYYVGVQLDVSAVEGAALEAVEEAAAAERSSSPASSGPAPYRLTHKMAHYGVTGAVRVACRSLSGGQGGLRRSLDCSGLPRKGFSRHNSSLASTQGSVSGSEGVPRHGSSPDMLQGAQVEPQAAAGGGSTPLAHHPRSCSSPAALRP